MIRLEGVSRTYRDGEREIGALRDVDLEVPPGSTVALMGRSGSGKSTLLHLVGGLEWPSAGSVRVAGRELGAMDDAELTRFRLETIGFVFQFFHLLPTLTVLENLLLPAELAGRPSRPAREAARALLEQVGLTERAGSYPERLSGGEQQRIAVARALLLDPPVLLADEPTGSLDTENGRRVLDLLWRLTGERGTTLLVATHSPELAARAGRCIELHDGRIAADRTTPGAPRDQVAVGPGAAGPGAPGPSDPGRP